MGPKLVGDSRKLYSVRLRVIPSEGTNTPAPASLRLKAAPRRELTPLAETGLVRPSRGLHSQVQVHTRNLAQVSVHNTHLHTSKLAFTYKYANIHTDFHPLGKLPGSSIRGSLDPRRESHLVHSSATDQL